MCSEKYDGLKNGMKIMMKLQFDKLEWERRFVYMKNIAFDEKALNQSGAKFQFIRFLPNTRLGPHFHKQLHEIFFISSGSGMIVFNKKKHKARKGDVFLCQPNDVHEIVNDSEEELVILNFKTNEKPHDIFWLEKEKNRRI
jgi:quercetin dioxygenase-like cupin family protein